MGFTFSRVVCKAKDNKVFICFLRSEGIFFFENARCTATLERHAEAGAAADGVSLSAINQYIARELIGCTLLPSFPLNALGNSDFKCRPLQERSTGKSYAGSISTETSFSFCAPLRSVACRLCPLRAVITDVSTHPAFKLLTCRYLPQSLVPQGNNPRLAPYSFLSLLRRMQRMFTRADTLDLHAPPGSTIPLRQRQNHYAETQQRWKNQQRRLDSSDESSPNAAVGARFCLRGPEINISKGTLAEDYNVALWPYALQPVQVCCLATLCGA